MVMTIEQMLHMTSTTLTVEQRAAWVVQRRRGVVSRGCLNDVAHEKNRDLWEEAGRVAQKLGLELRHNIANTTRWQGRHSYVILLAGAKNISRRSREAICHTWAFHSREGLPSIRGEREALEELLEQLTVIQDELVSILDWSG